MRVAAILLYGRCKLFEREPLSKLIRIKDKYRTCNSRVPTGRGGERDGRGEDEKKNKWNTFDSDDDDEGYDGITTPGDGDLLQSADFNRTTAAARLVRGPFAGNK